MPKNSSKKWIGILSLVFGILVIIKPELLSIVVGLYLIISGILVLFEK